MARIVKELRGFRCWAGVAWLGMKYKRTYFIRQ
jgi:hypothetical protein